MLLIFSLVGRFFYFVAAHALHLHVHLNLNLHLPASCSCVLVKFPNELQLLRRDSNLMTSLFNLRDVYGKQPAGYQRAK